MSSVETGQMSAAETGHLSCLTRRHLFQGGPGGSSLQPVDQIAIFGTHPGTQPGQTGADRGRPGETGGVPGYGVKQSQADPAHPRAKARMTAVQQTPSNHARVGEFHLIRIIEDVHIGVRDLVARGYFIPGGASQMGCGPGSGVPCRTLSDLDDPGLRSVTCDV